MKKDPGEIAHVLRGRQHIQIIGDLMRSQEQQGFRVGARSEERGGTAQLTLLAATGGDPQRSIGPLASPQRRPPGAQKVEAEEGDIADGTPQQVVPLLGDRLPIGLLAEDSNSHSASNHPGGRRGSHRPCPPLPNSAHCTYGGLFARAPCRTPDQAAKPWGSAARFLHRLRHELSSLGRITAMPPSLEADVALIHIAGGDARVSAPPGTLAQTPPRRAARGRGDDMLFVTLAPSSGQPGAPSPLDSLARQAAQTFFGTPGTITAALREAATDVNQRLLQENQREAASSHLEGRLMAGVLRGNDLYLAQVGSGLGVLVRPGQITRFASEEAAARPLGVAVAPNVRFHHAQVGAGDILLLTASPSASWSDGTLAGLAGLEAAQAVERLVAGSHQDLTGLLIRVTSPSVSPARAAVSPPAIVGTVRSRGRAPGAEGRPGGLRRQPTPTSRAVGRALATITLPFQAIARGLTRMFPSLAPSSSTSGMSSGLLAATAVAVPLVVVALVTVVYLRRGRTEQYRQFLSQAQTAVVAAQLKPSLEEARPEWEAADQWLNQADAYGHGPEAQALREEVRQALDQLDNIARLEFAPAVGGGFGPRARLRAVAATANDLYVFDESIPEIYHAWFTGRGYEIDREFQCLQALQPGFEPGRIIDLLIQPEPGALGTQGIVAIDAAGNLI